MTICKRLVIDYCAIVRHRKSIVPQKRRGKQVKNMDKRLLLASPHMSDEGYELADVLVDGRSVGAVGRYTFEKVHKNHTITAVFTASQKLNGVDRWLNTRDHIAYLSGYPDGTFGPQKLITRAEAMTMVNRTIDRHPDADHLLDDMIVWPDNPETAWYYEQVQEATNSHEYTMNTDDEQNPYEIWTELLPNRDWSELEKAW